MPSYISPDRLQLAVDRLGSSRATQRFADFLVTKRALKIAGADQIAMSLRAEPLQRAITELMAVYPANFAGAATIDAPLVNVFGTSGHDDKGFRTDKYRSNGTAVTVPRWRDLVEVSGSKPRTVKLRPNHVAQLPPLLLKNAGEFPQLVDAAVWFFRHTAIDQIGTGSAALVAAFKQELALSDAEQGAIFAPLAGAETIPVTDTLADPASYLPTLPTAAAQTAAPAASTDRCSVHLLLAIACRGFAILTGPAGTGKSRGVIHLAQGVEAVLGGTPGDSYAFTAVGADWVDSRPLLGYRNPFGPPRQSGGATTNETYQLTDFVRLLFRAHKNGSAPHFLILDEMNLSHVERYMSSLLSLIEANRSVSEASRQIAVLDAGTVALIADVLEVDSPGTPEAEAARELASAKRPLIVPGNVFIAGTVNVDETTYMFSPKVLDRAHVLELEPPDPAAYLNGTMAPTEMIQVTAAVELLQWATEANRRLHNADAPSEFLRSACTEIGVPTSDIDEILASTAALLKGAHHLLSPVGFAFGIRVINDFLVYVVSWLKAMRSVRAGDPSFFEDWPEALDRAFVQKVLPKLHGNRRQLGDSLSALGAFLGGAHRESDPPARYELGESDAIGIEPGAVLDLGADTQMAGSRRKLEEMHRRLSATGYVSFVR
jgi:hypothetical protein